MRSVNIQYRSKDMDWARTVIALPDETPLPVVGDHVSFQGAVYKVTDRLIPLAAYGDVVLELRYDRDNFY